ncbi:hypothetical protein CHU32_04900 [Superficieibacter electus]|uniref:Uncharacterized protein n=1 Tax=Superficieibacter electus TaxID=2022662 RepID=A0A2P5GU84_9ENTR|nr:hypothetical protein [Superficieibacter electus]POP47274.1 hypothetical protein CHU33_03345 [Superficieibacter electus]POP50121.1 hypothetical protein CHU32_04900 [Superficieibacter electus]
MSLQIAFITGRSQPGKTALSPPQRAFINTLSREGEVVPANFPWVIQRDVWQETPLVQASINNARDYLGSRRPAFVRTYQAAAVALLESAEHTLLLSGSCGLELFNNLQLPNSLMSRVSLFAWGPVAQCRPDCRHLLVQGRQDWISRLWFRKPDVYITCGHMNYLTQPALADLCIRFIRTF